MAIAWYATRVVAPIGPVLLGLLFRSLGHRGMSLACLGTVELAFSMVAVSFLMVITALSALEKRRDTRLISLVVTYFSLLLLASAGLFGFATCTEARILAGVPALLSAVSSETVQVTAEAMSARAQTATSLGDINFTRSAQLAVSFLTIVGVGIVGSKSRYRW